MMQQPLELKFGGCLNDNVPRAGSIRYLNTAEQWAAEQGWHHWNAARWIRGLAGGLHRLDPRRDGFRAEDVTALDGQAAPAMGNLSSQAEMALSPGTSGVQLCVNDLDLHIYCYCNDYYAIG